MSESVRDLLRSRYGATSGRSESLPQVHHHSHPPHPVEADHGVTAPANQRST